MRLLLVHILHDAPKDRELARLFGEETAFTSDKLAQCNWEPGPDGTPVLQDLDYFSGLVPAKIDLGDHVGFVLDVGPGRSTRSGARPLSFQQIRHLDAGNPA